MAAGLIVWDEYGRVVLDMTTRMGRVLGITAIGTANGSISPAGWNTGTLWYAVMTDTDYPPVFSVNATTIFWNWDSVPASSRLNLVILFGVH